MVEKRMMKNCAICGKHVRQVGKIQRVMFGFQTIKVCKNCRLRLKEMRKVLTYREIIERIKEMKRLQSAKSLTLR
jgi:ribosome-binding protein aMBF1 (putative translation factor)